MKLEKELVVCVIILVFLLAVFIVNNPTITGYSVMEETNDMLGNAQLSFNDLNLRYGEFFDIFEITLGEAKLTEIQTKLKSLGAEADDLEILSVQAELKSFLDPLPKRITSSVVFKDSQILELKDIKSSYTLESKKELYLYQKNINVIFETINYNIELYSGSKVDYTVIKKIITANPSLTDVTIYEMLPININKVSFKEKSYTTDDNIAKYEFSSLSNNQITYGIKEGLDVDKIYEFKTIVVPKKTSGVEIKSFDIYICGDNLCTSPYEDEITCPEDCRIVGKGIPWRYIIVGIIVLAIGAFYLNLYRGRGDFRRLTKGKNPFKSSIELENVKKFIKSGMDKGLKPIAISKALLGKAWSKKQIEYAYEEARWEARRVLLNTAPKSARISTKPAEEYVKKCRAMGIDDLKIKIALISKGWKPEQIDPVFKKKNQK